ncbi:MAG: phosphatase PAP2 family protein [Tatlockia sp.]|jgi:membrane-associated phospholipid phosphatase
MMRFERLFNLLTKPLAVILYFSLVVLLILFWDKAIASYFYSLDLRHKLPIISFITRLGLSPVYFAVFIGLGLYCRYIKINKKTEAKAWFLLSCITIPAILCIFFKVLLGRARPNLYLFDNIYGFYGLKWNANYWSLPSGHTTTIMSVMLGLSIVFPRYFYPFLLTGITVAFSRVMLTHHYLSDILVAFYLVVLELGLLLALFRKKTWLAPSWKHDV